MIEWNPMMVHREAVRALTIGNDWPSCNSVCELTVHYPCSSATSSAVFSLTFVRFEHLGYHPSYCLKVLSELVMCSSVAGYVDELDTTHRVTSLVGLLVRPFWIRILFPGNQSYGCRL